MRRLPHLLLVTCFGLAGALDAQQAAEGWLVRTLPVPRSGDEGHTGPVFAVATTPDGRLLVSGGSDAKLKIWGLPDGALVRTLSGHTWPVNSIAITPDERYVASGSDDRTIKIWQLADGRLVKTMTGHRGAVACVAISPDGETLLSGSWDGSIKIWRLPDGILVRTLNAHVGPVFCVAFAPDGEKFVSGGADSTLRLWRLRDGAQMGDEINHGAPVFCTAFASRGEVLLSGGADTTIRTWLVAKLEPRQALVGHSGPVRSLAITTNGAHVISGSYDGTIRIWRLSDGLPVRTITNLNGTSMCLAVMPDGSSFISGRSDNTIKLWHLPVIEDGVSRNAGPMSQMVPPEHRVDSRLAGTTVAVLVTPLECPAMDTVRSGTLTEKLRVELDQAGGFRVMERDRLDAVMAEQGRWLSGCFTNTCASNIGDLAGADYVIVGRVAQIEDMYSVTLRIVETATSETAGSAAIECSPCAFSGVMRESMRAAAMALRDDFQRRARGR